MSRWRHNICRECYAKYEPGREPIAVNNAWCPPNIESASLVFDPAGYDPDECAGCGAPKSGHLAKHDKCCFCGNDNSDGIYYRYNPEQLVCKGEHP